MEQQQAELFAIEIVERPLKKLEVPGFELVEGYISEREEMELISHIDAKVWQTDYKRRIQQYGLGYGSENGGKPAWLRDFPGWLLPLAQRVSMDAPLERFAENCVINEYIPPQGIGSHRDYMDFGPTVACVSLLSPVVMNLKNIRTGETVAINIPQRSFWSITGPARYEWEHGIAARLNDVVSGERRKRERRVSITFRTGATKNER